jgi:hypothetical protein
VSAKDVIGFHFKLTCFGKIEVAVGVFILVGGPSVKTVTEVESGPYPTLFIAATLNLKLVFAGKVCPVGASRVKEL